MTATLSTDLATDQSISKRIQSIDLLRGIVMIIMALDHVRDYFHDDAFLFNPLDLEQTSTAIFFTRWITHYCAPVFVFLAGTSAYLVGYRKGKKELSAFLFKRGIWLIVLEITVINFSWFFNIGFSLIALTVIWALGAGMLILSAAVHLNYKVILTTGLIIIFGHNLLDSVHVDGNNALAIGWSLLHVFQGFQLNNFFLFVGYPILPWTAVMFLGYCFGKLYEPNFDAGHRKKIILNLGLSAIALFIVIRFVNIYGDLVPWSTQSSAWFTFLSFLNVTKYPPSLLYLLVTLGPSLVFLAVSENMKGKLSSQITALGRVPMFYYIIHLYWIHLIALVAALAIGFTVNDMVFNTWVTDSPTLRGYGFGLPIVYLVWAFVVISLFPLCLWYDRYKVKNKDKWWLSYL